jgi:beta-lactamase class A
MKLNGLSLVSLAMAAMTGGAISYLFTLRTDGATAAIPSRAPAEPAKPDEGCAYSIKRVQGFHRVQPVLYSEPLCESPRLAGLRASITTMMEGLRSSGQLTSGSVYVRDFRQAEWTWYNGSAEYDPGSLLKVPLLLTYLGMAEEDPGMMQRTWTCDAHDFSVPQHTAFPSAQAQLNISYTVKQLLELAIVHSDNRATVMLMRHVNADRYIRTYTDLGLPAPDLTAKAYRMNVRDYSVFMKALYNSALLGPLSSEYALELMTRAHFDRGLSAGLPAGVEVAHKFGEAGTEQERQLHETGLVYADGNPYLITVMTEGPNVDTLASAIASVSKLVYERMSTP